MTTLMPKEARIVATLLANALEQDHDEVAGDYFWFLLSDEEMDRYDSGDVEAVEGLREAFDDLRASVQTIIDKCHAAR